MSAYPTNYGGTYGQPPQPGICPPAQPGGYYPPAPGPCTVPPPGPYYPQQPTTVIVKEEKKDDCAKDCCLCALCMALCCFCCSD